METRADQFAADWLSRRFGTASEYVRLIDVEPITAPPHLMCHLCGIFQGRLKAVILRLSPLRSHLFSRTQFEVEELGLIEHCVREPDLILALGLQDAVEAVHTMAQTDPRKLTQKRRGRFANFDCGSTKVTLELHALSGCWDVDFTDETAMNDPVIKLARILLTKLDSIVLGR